MNKLADKRIRSALRSHLARSTPVAILDEIRVHNGNAIADVVTVDEGATHCYEIKGESDEIRRIVRQGSFYDLAFIKTTLVTTQNHLSTATSLAPGHWGILVASEGKTGVLFRRLRTAKQSPHFSKEVALLTLWRSELISLCNSPDEQLKKLSREKLAAKIAVERPVREITHHIGDLLVKRQTNKRWALTM
ncbi:sce7726 family protein [Xanthomonas campestris pv. raphani]|uniref:sce7726 family protein n=1 Tax=Xanthomonas campestris TaxID=339 RepID=UPI0025A1659C|nr:sce7726 family protein [Xanthomonas campestris]MDM7586263.1 sce7726 family protein [Xanthomonas campestris]MDM7593525.1 sce7726 family protein [Xanthomonas campestris]MEA9786465.1 sce7726 family protein [Xanthomonas campestris pv. raphani]MEA9865643.1 sce7726 family protein [Xanthomonas campestris pv. raphani]